MSQSAQQTQRQTDCDAIIMAALPHVPFDGWSDACLRRAAETAGFAPGDVPRLFPGGARAAVVHFMEMADRLMVADLAARDLSALKIRERIALAVRVRLERWQDHREAIRRALTLLPSMAGAGLRGWAKTVDAIWRAIGDRSSDFSYYTKRMLLAGVYGSTLLYWLDDRSEGAIATWAFLDRRIADVLRIPQLRARLTSQFKGVPRPGDVLRGFARGRGRVSPGRTGR
jgi:ubiquinone biosynthesis protein COQ9